jgi:hypothetical protein
VIAAIRSMLLNGLPSGGRAQGVRRPRNSTSISSKFNPERFIDANGFE